MKKLLFSSLCAALLFTSAVNAWDPITSDTDKVDGSSVFESNGCTMCHDVQIEKVGPSLQTIRMHYGLDEDALVRFFKGNGEARVYPQKFAIMRSQLEKTKALYDNEVRALARYILDIEKF